MTPLPACARSLRRRLLPALTMLYCACVAVWLWGKCEPRPLLHGDWWLFTSHSDFDGFDNNTGIDPALGFLVPNYVHFLLLNRTQLTFLETVCILAAYTNQRPDKLFFHHDERELGGIYWRKLKLKLGSRLHIRLVHTYGLIDNTTASLHRMEDLFKMRVLKEHGGIFLDTHSYLVQSLDPFRRFEATVGWARGGLLAHHVLVAHKDARVLPLAYEAVDNSMYSRWERRFARLVLETRPELIHRVTRRFGTEGLERRLYHEVWGAWRDQYVIRQFDTRVIPSPAREYTILVNYLKFSTRNTFSQMARSVGSFFHENSIIPA